MSIFYRWVFIIALLVVGAIGTAGQDTDLEISNYLGRTVVPEVKMSPNGRYVAVIASNANLKLDRTDTVIWLIELDAAGKKVAMKAVAEGEGTIHSQMQWSPDGRYLAYLKSVPGPNRMQVDRGLYHQVVFGSMHLNILELASSKTTQISGTTGFAPAPRSFRWMPNSTALVFWASGKFYRQSAVEIGIKTSEPIATTERAANSFVISPDGRLIYYRPNNNLFVVDIASGKQIKQLTNAPSFPAVYSLEWTRKGPVYLASGSVQGDKVMMAQRKLYVFDKETGEMARVAPDFTGDQYVGFEELPDGSIISIAVESTRFGIYKASPGARNHTLLSAYPGYVFDLSLSSDATRIAFVLADNKSFQEVYVAPGHDKLDKAVPVTSFNSALTNLPKPSIERISWNNTDGGVVEGVLFHPPGMQGATKLPLIVTVHGGPTAATPESVDQKESLYASRGYRVLSINYRGSTGRGDDFATSFINFPCSRPADDVTSGTEYAISRGLADPGKLGIYGISAGALVTNCVIGRTTRFKAAVSSEGIWNSTAAGFPWHFGGKLPWDDPKLYWEESAISRAPHIKTPTFINVGADDTVTPPSQSQEMARALSYLNVPNKLTIYPGEGHVFYKPSNQLKRLTDELAWFDHYLLGKPNKR